LVEDFQICRPAASRTVIAMRLNARSALSIRIGEKAASA
jgi:hypothetical protein